ncbi:MAG: hypothetical protein AB7R69_03690 [Candidatus Babeliales bacterium]
MNYTKGLFIALVFGTFFVMEASLSKVICSLEEFIQHEIPSADQREFRLFYNDLMHDQQKKKLSLSQSDLKQVQEEITAMQRAGKTSLEVRNPSLAQKVALNEKNVSVQKNIKELLYRYGAYEKFCNNRAGKLKNIISKTRAYMKDTSNKMMAFFKRNRSEKPA